MWEIPKHAGAEFRANGWKLVVAAAGDGVSLVVSRRGLGDSHGRLWIPQAQLTSCREKYIRGDALYLTFSDPQTDPLGLDLVLMAVEADQNLLILESVISLGTSLLDSHPAVELQVDAGAAEAASQQPGCWRPLADAASQAGSSQAGAPQEQTPFIWVQAETAGRPRGARSPGPTGSIVTGVLCDQRDRLSLDQAALQSEGRLRFFGDFLEKGVIRKVQPWWVWSSEPVSERSRKLIAGHLAARPLPLTH